MADNKNIKLNDEEMIGATGGTTEGEGLANPYDEYGTIGTYLGDCVYSVRLDNERIVTAEFPYRTILDPGTKVGLLAGQSEIADYLAEEMIAF